MTGLGIEKRQRRLAAATVLLATFAALGAAETLVRIAAPRKLWVFTDATSDWRLDAELGWTNRPSYSTESMTDTGLVAFRTNADGILGAPARTKRSGVTRIMLFGDSTVLGRGVSEPDRLHRQLELLLPKVEALNAGVQGYSTDQALLLMRRLIPLYRPDVVVYGLCQNDFDGIGWRRNYGAGKPKCAAAGGALQGCEPPRTEDLRLQRLGERDLAYLLQSSALYRLLQPGILALRLRFTNFEYAGGGLSPALYEGAGAASIPNFELFEALLLAMRRTADEHQSRFLFYSHPALEEVWDPAVASAVARHPRFDRYWLERALSGVAARHGLSYCPLVERFRARQDEGPFHLLPRDPHCNARGYAVTAEALSLCLRALEP